MKIEIVIIAEEGSAPGRTTTYALGLEVVAMGADGLTRLSNHEPDPVILQRGYASPRHALAALLECLTFSPPDLSTYDEGLAHVSGLLDRTTDLESAMTSVGGRLNDVEEKVEAMVGPIPGGSNRLLPPRVAPAGQPTALAQPQNANPSIRRPAGRTMISAGHAAGGRNGNSPLAITGGVGRRGDLGPTGAGADDEGGVDTGD